VMLKGEIIAKLSGDKLVERFMEEVEKLASSKD
jgi:hypothetical protein